MTPELRALLNTIGLGEAPKGYGQIYGGAKGVPKDTDVSKLTLKGVLDFQKRMLKGGSASTACGRYQFINKTLLATINQMRLDVDLLWDATLQDRMAVHLIEGRGLEIYLTGNMSAAAFCNNLAMEWASLPVVTRIQGAHRVVNPGESYYMGDKLNKSFHKPEEILALVTALRTPSKEISVPTFPEAVPTQPTKPHGLLMALLDLLAMIFKRRT